MRRRKVREPRYGLMLLGSIAVVTTVAAGLYILNIIGDATAISYGFVAIVLPSGLIGRRWLLSERKRHPHAESNRAMDIIKSLPPEYEDYFLRFLEARRYSRPKVDVVAETQRIANILREIPEEERSAVITKVSEELKRQARNPDSFYNVGPYDTYDPLSTYEY